MADENIVEFTDNNEIDMDYLDMDSPEPEPKPSDVEDMKEEHYDEYEEYEEYDNKQDSIEKSRHSYTMNNQTQAILKQFQSTINELQLELKSSQNENERLMVKNETLIIEYDAKIDELNLEIDELQIESQQYQIRYSEINEELHELRSSQADSISSGKENKELLIRLQNKEQNEMSLMIDLEQSNKQNQTLKHQIKSAHENSSKLQKAMIQLKKDKTILDKNFQSTADKYDMLQKQSHLEITNLNSRLQQLERENEIYRQNLSNAEAEKIEMQNTFTEATMELLHDELNDAHNDIKQESTSLRLERVSTSDMSRSNYNYNNDSMDLGQSNMSSHFIKQRFGSQTSLPDQTLLDTFNEQDEINPYHSRKSSLDSRLGTYENIVDPIKLKQDIRDILINDIKILLNQELNNNTHTQTQNSDTIDPQLFKQFEQSINDKIKNILESKNDTKQFENIINNKIKEILESVNNVNNEIQLIYQQQQQQNEEENKEENNNNEMEQMERMKEMLTQTIESQMSVFQISLENQIGNAVNENLQEIINDKINGKLRDDIKIDINEIKNEIINNNNNNKNNYIPQQPLNTDDDNNTDNTTEIINKKLEDAMNNVMNGKIDNFMGEFRKEVIPEFMAMFEELNNKTSNYQNTSDDDDEKANSNRNELLLSNEKLKKEIEILKQEKNQHDKILRNAATSKVHQVVKLQNLLDHMRNDNRLLQFQLSKYQQTFNKIKLNQQNNVVNKFWGYLGQSTSTHLST